MHTWMTPLLWTQEQKNLETDNVDLNCRRNTPKDSQMWNYGSACTSEVNFVLAHPTLAVLGLDIFLAKHPWNTGTGHGNRDHETSSTRGRLQQFTTKLSNPNLDRLLNKAFQAPSTGWGCVIPITVPYWMDSLLNSIYIKSDRQCNEYMYVESSVHIN